MVSVIVPNFNHETFLKERLDSIFSQTYTDFEVIVLDDCSTDGSLEVIDRYRGHPRLSAVVVNETNSGSPFKQWKKGMEIASGEFIWIAESDDSCDSVFLERLMPAFDDPLCVLSYCASQMTDAAGNSLGLHPNLLHLPAFHIEGPEFVRRYLSKYNSVVNASSAVFRKNAGLAVENGYDSFGSYGDWLFWIGLASSGNVSYIPDELNRFRFHSSNTTGRTGLSAEGVRESLATDDFLYEYGLMSRFRRFRRRVDLYYRLEYVVGDSVNGSSQTGMDGLSAIYRTAIRLKRIKRLILHQL